jgi:hypothetical protein
MITLKNIVKVLNEMLKADPIAMVVDDENNIVKFIDYTKRINNGN